MAPVPLNMTLRFEPVVGMKLNVPAVNVIVAPAALPITTLAGVELVIDPAVSTNAVAVVPKLNFAVPVEPKSTAALALANVNPLVRVTVVFTPTEVPTNVKVLAVASVIGLASVGITTLL